MPLSADALLIVGALGAGGRTGSGLAYVIARHGVGAPVAIAEAQTRAANAIVEAVQAGRIEYLPSALVYRLTEAAAGKDRKNPDAAHRPHLTKRGKR